MWLVNTRTLKLESFTDATVVHYAILSHTWGDEEISFQDMADIEAGNTYLKKRAGYHKIKRTCELAQRDKLDYAWIDSCTINKNSSAELSEAINSMFAWYKKAQVCYVYLADLELDTMANNRSFEEESDERNSRRKRKDASKKLRQCRWFYRSWTLQELIAPKKVELYNKDWTCIGCKGPADELDGHASSVDLTELLAEITSIDSDVLLDDSLLSRIPVARRLSWAASREATRIEDEAYSLMGIFDVNMPLLYGEGSKAFARLQEQIFHETHDLSLFAWKQTSVTGFDYQYFRGIFAVSPREFWASSHLRANQFNRGMRHDYKLDGDCLQIDISCQTEDSPDGQPTLYFLDLDCVGPSASFDPDSSGTLKRQNDSQTSLDQNLVWLSVILTKHGREFVRASPENFLTTHSRLAWNQNCVKRPVRIRKHLPQAESFSLLDNEVLTTKTRATVEFDCTTDRIVSLCKGIPSPRWSPVFFKGRPDQFFVEFSSDGHGDDLASVGILPFTLSIRPSGVKILLALVLILPTSPFETPGSESGKYSFALFDDRGMPEEPSTRIAALAHCFDPDTGPDPVRQESVILDEVKDEIFVNFENTWGGLSTTKLPTSVEIDDADGTQCYTISVEERDTSQSGHRARLVVTHSEGLPELDSFESRLRSVNLKSKESRSPP